MVEKIKEILQNRDVIIPGLLFYNYRKLNMNADELILVSYLIGVDSSFNPKKMSSELNIPLGELMDMLEHLKELDIAKIELKKIDNVRKEVINMEGLYNKLIALLVEEKPQDNKSQIYDIFEKEFGRTLSPIEYEIINAWQDNKIEEETIVLALKEAVYNGVTNLRYIDKILNEWSKKGIKTQADLDGSRKVSKPKQELSDIDYDWLTDEE